LLGVTGSGKTFTVANVIAQVNRPTLVMSPNKILAAQLYAELKAFFPITRWNISFPITTITNRKPTFPKATPTLKKTRPSTTTSTGSAKSHLVAAGTARCGGGGVGVVHLRLGSPRDYRTCACFWKRGAPKVREDLLRELVDIQYERNEIAFSRGKFRVKGDVVEIFPAYLETALRVELDGDRVARLREFDP
jgi:excinuclease ABC subunit B